MSKRKISPRFARALEEVKGATAKSVFDLRGVSWGGVDHMIAKYLCGEGWNHDVLPYKRYGWSEENRRKVLAIFLVVRGESKF